MKENRYRSLIKPWVLVLSAVLLLIFALAVAGLILNLTKTKEENSSENTTKITQDWNSIVRQYYYDSNTKKGKLDWETDFFGKNDLIVSFAKIPQNKEESFQVFDKELLEEEQIYKFLANEMGIVDYQKIKFYNSFVIRISTNVNNLFDQANAAQLELEVKNEQLVRQNLLNKDNDLINQADADAGENSSPTPYSVTSTDVSDDAKAKKIGYENQKAFRDSNFKLFLLSTSEEVDFENYQLALLFNLQTLALKVVIKTLKTDGNAEASLKIESLASSDNKGGVVWKSRYYYAPHS